LPLSSPPAVVWRGIRQKMDSCSCVSMLSRLIELYAVSWRPMKLQPAS
jgi:hypothetical protein